MASLDKVFLPDDKKEKYKGPALPPPLDVLLQLAEGLEYIHELPLIHRDIKPGNVLISVDGNSQAVIIKWADFGLSRPVNERGSYQSMEVAGTPNWLAPELLDQVDFLTNSTQKQPLRSTLKSDIFAEGLLFGYYLGGGIHPYGTSDPRKQTPTLHRESLSFFPLARSIPGQHLMHLKAIRY